MEKVYIDRSNIKAYKKIKAIIDNRITKGIIVIEGENGVGKTYFVKLLIDKCTDKKVKYFEAMEFFDECVLAIKDNRKKEFYDSIYSNDILVIDDIYFLSSKKYVQDEIARIINHLLKGGKIVVITTTYSLWLMDMCDKLYEYLKLAEYMYISSPGRRAKERYARDYLKERGVKCSFYKLRKIIKSSKEFRELTGRLNTFYFQKNRQNMTN